MSENTNQAPLLEVKHLRKLFPAKSGFLAKEKTYIKAVDDVSFSLMPRETLGVVGESGCGKSVTSLSILRLVPSPPGRILEGEILLKGKARFYVIVRVLWRIYTNEDIRHMYRHWQEL